MAENNLSSAGSSGPNLWSYGQYQVGLWVDASWHVIVGIRTHTYSTLGRFDSTFNLSSLPALKSAWSNTITTAANPLGVVSDDSHETPAMALDGDGYIHVARYIHQPTIDAIPRLIRSKFAVSDPAFVLTDPTQWVDEAADITDPLDGYHEYNYFAPFPNGDLLLMHATRIILPGSGGTSQPSWQWCYVKLKGQTHWTNRGIVAQGGPHGAANNQDAFYINCPYISQTDPLDVNASRIHLFGAWSGVHSGGGIGAAIIGEHSYVYSDDSGVTWRNITGTAMTLPFSKASGVSARTGTAASPTPAPPAWSGTFGTDEDDNIYSFGCTVDQNGRPCGTYSKRTPPRAAGTGTSDSANLASYARNGNVVTLTFNANPFTQGWVAGETIVVQTGVPAFDGTFILTAVTTSTASYAQTGANVATTANNGTVVHYSTLPANDPGAPSPIGHHVIRWNGAAWIQDSYPNYFGGGQLLNLANFRNDVWLLARKNSFIELRRLATPHEAIKICGPVSGADVSPSAASANSGRHVWADPISLRDRDTIEVLTTNFDVPRIASFGAGAKYRPQTNALPAINGVIGGPGRISGGGWSLTAWAVINDVIAPTTITYDGSSEVGMVGQFNTVFNLYGWLRSLPASTRARLQPGGIYWCDRGLEFEDTTSNLVIDLNGAEVQNRTDKPYLPVNPDQTVHDANWTANRNRATFLFNDGDYVCIHNGTIRGSNGPPGGGADGATDPNLEAQAGLRFFGTRHFEVFNVSIIDTWGDGVFMQRNTNSGRNCMDAYVHGNDIYGCARHGICPTGVIGWRVFNNRIFDIRRHIIDAEPNDGAASITGGRFWNNDIGYGQLGYLSIATYGAVATVVDDNVFDMNRCTFQDIRHPTVQPGVTLHVNMDWFYGTVRMGDTTFRNHVTNRAPGYGTGSPGHGIWDKGLVTAYRRTANVATLTVNVNPVTRGWGGSAGSDPDLLRVATGNAAFDTAPNTTVPMTGRTSTTVSYANTGADVALTSVSGTIQHETPGAFGIDVPAMIQARNISNFTVVGNRSLDGNPPMLQPANGMWVVYVRNHFTLEVHGNETAGGAGELHDWNNP